MKNSKTVEKCFLFLMAGVLLVLNLNGVLSVVQAAGESQEAPTITLLGPQRNKKLPIGSTVKITWKAKNLKDNYSLVLSLETDEADLMGSIEVLSADLAKQGNYIWFIRGIIEDDIEYSIREGRYRIVATLYDGEVCLWHDCNVTDNGKEIARSTGDFFSITPATRMPLKLISPRKGDVLKIGDKKLIKWKTNVSHSKIRITLYRHPPSGAISQGNGMYLIAQGIPSRRTFSWTVDKKIPPGKYTLGIVDERSGDTEESEVFNLSNEP